MQLNHPPGKPASPPTGLGRKSDREKQVGAAVARAKAAATKRARRQPDGEIVSGLKASKTTASTMPLRIEVLFDQASPMARAVLGAERDACRWPVGEGQDFRFCGSRAVASKSGGLTLRSFYAAHAAVAYRGQTRIVAEAA